MARAEYRTRLQKDVSIMIVLLLLLQWWSSHGCLEEERAALLQLQHSFNYPNGTPRLLWDMNIDCCKWDGVECDVTTGRVNELYLTDSRDESLGEWNFNASVFLPFQQLRSLYLMGNNIVCCVKNEGFEGLQRLSNLEALYLEDNGLTNNVLSMFQGFHSLKILSLSFNKLNGSIYTKDLANITNLELLDLSNNNIEKFVSSEDIQSSSNISILALSFGICNGSSFELQSLKAFKNLKSLYLQDNNFKGVLFPQDDLNKLEELFLDDSDMDEKFLLSLRALRSLRLLSVGGIHYETLNNQSFLNSIANITSLESLLLSSCELTDIIDELYKLKNLRRLDLGGNNLIGTLPSYLANLTLLQYLDLSSNHFIGSISTSPLKSLTSIEYLSIYNNQFQIPISLSPFLNHSKLKHLYADVNEMFAESGGVDSNLTPKFQLQELVLSSTYGKGGVSFPKFLHHQYDLRSLDLFGVQMRGAEFPSWLLDNNTKLGSLYLGNCSLSGPLHLPIHPHPKLDILDISNNLFYGHIPIEIGRYLPMLYGLYLQRNDFVGKITNSLSNCSHLHLLDMNHNKLFDKVPQWIGNMSSLKLLDLSNNNLFGKIPNSLSNCSLLQFLGLSYNSLSGKIPKWIGNMSSLELLDLSNNNLFGSLPLIFIPPQASYISLSHNRLEGPFPDVLPNSSVAILDLSHNCLTGSIPNSIKNLDRLMFVLLNHNNLEGKIPIYLWKLMNELKFVDLSHNRFDTLSLKNNTFETPPEDGYAFYYEDGYAFYYNEYLEWVEKGNNYQFSIDYNELLELVEKGNTYQFYIERMLTIGFIGLDLSNNNLACSIPSEIGNKEGMKMLNLSHNNLIGHIPLLFSNMKTVESLDLSYNNLSGTFPPQFVQLKYLEVFSVAYNNISGKTPERVGQFATFEESSYRGNSFLCGLPLPKNCTPTEPSMTKESSTDDINDGIIDMEIFQISFWVTFTIMLLGIVSILYKNPYWRQAWFYFIELMITSCYYFLVDHLPFLSKFGITYLL